jgi:small subunit ribosomal protein S6
MQRTYEVMFIVRPDILDEDLDKLIAGLEGNITQGGGSIKSMEKLGRRKLAYTVKKFNSVRMDEEEKRVAKIKAIRATRKKLSAQPAAAPPAAVEAAPAPATEAVRA